MKEMNEVNPETSSPDEPIFVPIQDIQSLQKIQKKSYRVEPEPGGISLTNAPKKPGRVVHVSDETYAEIQKVRRFLRSLGGSEEAGRVLKKTGNLIDISDAVFYLAFRTKPDQSADEN